MHTIDTIVLLSRRWHCAFRKGVQFVRIKLIVFSMKINPAELSESDSVPRRTDDTNDFHNGVFYRFVSV